MSIAPNSLRRFWAKIKESDYCWEWQGAVSSTGYGSFRVDTKELKRTFSAHRLAYESYYGDIPIGMKVLHRCDNRKCCNPLHLFLGDHKDNMEDMVAKNRHVGNRLLTEEDVIAIRNRKAQGELGTEIASDYGVCSQQINSVCRGRAWPDTGGPRTFSKGTK